MHRLQTNLVTGFKSSEEGTTCCRTDAIRLVIVDLKLSGESLGKVGCKDFVACARALRQVEEVVDRIRLGSDRGVESVR